MGIFCAIVIGVPGALFTAVQLTNLLNRKVRLGVSYPCLALAIAAIVLAVMLDVFSVAASGLLVWFFGWIMVSNKWWHEVQEDVTGREDANLPVLLRSWFLPVSWRSAIDGFWQLRYRRRMFRDPWSRRYLVKLSQPLPARWMDAETIALVEAIQREEDEAD